jgi:hypothetical protein
MVLPESHCGRLGWNNPYTCVEGQECVMFRNAWALEGVLSFDNIGASILTVCMVILRVFAPHLYCAPKLRCDISMESSAK